jgi:hypothetical protein
MADVLPSQLVNSIMAKLYDVLTGSPEVWHGKRNYSPGPIGPVGICSDREPDSLRRPGTSGIP